MATYYTFVILIAVGTAFIMMVVTHGNIMLSSEKKLIFTALFGFIALGALCEWGAFHLQGKTPELNGVVTVIKTIEFSVTPSICVLYACVYEDKNEKLIFIAKAMVGLHALIECFLAPFGIIFYCDDQGFYRHGVAYGVYVFAYVLSAVFMVISVKRSSTTFQYRNRRLPWLCLALVGVGALAQMIDPQIRIVWVALAVAATILYLFYNAILMQCDGLTRLLNRSCYNTAMSHIDKPCIIIFFDLNYFKEINDTQGHQAGDACLQGVARAIFHVFAPVGSCYRIGGDEFCVIMKYAPEMLEQLKQDFVNRLAFERKVIPYLPTVSVGSAELDPSITDPEMASHCADVAMYENKRQMKEELAGEAGIGSGVELIAAEITAAAEGIDDDEEPSEDTEAAGQDQATGEAQSTSEALSTSQVMPS